MNPIEERVLTLIAESETDKYTPTAWDIAEGLVDQDVSNGEYEGCSSELEMAFGEYQQVAERMLAELNAEAHAPGDAAHENA